MGADLLAALALLLIIEGLLPGLNPAAWRKVIQQAAGLSDSSLRLVGIGSMISGAILLRLVL